MVVIVIVIVIAIIEIKRIVFVMWMRSGSGQRNLRGVSGEFRFDWNGEKSSECHSNSNDFQIPDNNGLYTMLCGLV